MSVIALMSWWDEQPGWLTRSVTPLARFCTHLVAVDGAYQHIPGSIQRSRSPGDQADAVVAACDATGLGLTLQRPTEPWAGDEVAKRNHMFQLAKLIAIPGDWLFVIDADEMVVEVPADIGEQLDRAAAERYESCMVDVTTPPAQGVTAVRKFFRYDRTLRVEGRHWHYHAGPAANPRVLWGNSKNPRLVSACKIERFRVEHWAGRRHPFRRDQQLGYYNRRKELGLEADVVQPR